MAYQKNIANDYKPEGLELVDKIISNVDQMQEGHTTIMSSNLVLQLIADIEISTSNVALRNKVNNLIERVELLELAFYNLQNNT